MVGAWEAVVACSLERTRDQLDLLDLAAAAAHVVDAEHAHRRPLPRPGELRAPRPLQHLLQVSFNGEIGLREDATKDAVVEPIIYCYSSTD